jgi:pyruvate dehydrogenase E2 component (dihydrolipoamide acetyltransferase)
MGDFVMPSLGADMEAGSLIEWLVKPGDKVERGQTIAVVGTEKGEIDVEVWEDGVVGQLVVEEGQEVPVGAVLATIRGEGETETATVKADVAEKKPTAVGMAVPAGAPPPATPIREAAPPPRNGHRIRVSPLARRLAKELGVDLNQIQGTGPQGAISRADVERAAAQAKAASEIKPAAKVEPKPETKAKPPAAAKKAAREAKKKGNADFQAGMRRAIAAAMAKSNREIPHYYLETRIDMQTALAWLEAENQKRSIRERVLPVVLLIKAVALSLAKIPQLNGYWIDDHLEAQEGIHIGFAIALRQGGLITPAIHHADLKDMDELMAAMRDLITRTRAGRLKGSEMTDATITLTNLGDMGVEKVYGVIYPPQVALVGFGKVTEEVWVESGMIGVRPVIHATLAGDHRASDGRTGGEFLDILHKYLQEPERLWE